MTTAQQPPAQELIISMPGDEMQFEIMMYNGKFMTYRKSEILTEVRNCYFHGMCDIELVEQKVIDSRHIDIMRKLYHMATEPKLKGWVLKFTEFRKAPVRSHQVCEELIAAFEELQTIPDDATNELRELHKLAEKEYKYLLTLRF